MIPGLAPLQGIAHVRVVHCTVSAELAWTRRTARARRAHAEPRPGGEAAEALRHGAFERLSLDTPWLEVDTGEGYQPGLEP